MQLSMTTRPVTCALRAVCLPCMQAGIVQRSMLSLASGQSMALRSMTEGNSALSKSAAYLGRVQSNMAGLSTRVREELANNPTPSYMERPVGMTNTWR